MRPLNIERTNLQCQFYQRKMNQKGKWEILIWNVLTLPCWKRYYTYLVQQCFSDLTDLGIDWRNRLWILIQLVEWDLKFCISDSWMLSIPLGRGPFEQYSPSTTFLPSRWDQLAWEGWGSTPWCPGSDYLAPQAESPGETGNRLEHICFNFANTQEIMSVWSTQRFVFFFFFLHGKHLLIDAEYDYNTV